MTNKQTEQSDELGWRMTGNAGEVADILMEFAQELRRGDIAVWKGQRELHLDPMGHIDFRVEAISEDSGQEGLHLHMRWTRHTPDEDALGGGAAFSDNVTLG